MTRDGSAIRSTLHGVVADGAIAGAVTLVSRPGEAPEVVTAGWRDIEAGQLMTRDTIMRIASMTKPITSTAALMLHGRGLFAMDDPITRWALEFSDMRELRDPDVALADTVPTGRGITFLDLSIHARE